MSEYIITDEQLRTAAEACSEHELSLPITEVFISGDKLPEIVRCRDCLSWHRGFCYKHAYEVANEYGDTFTEGVFPMDDSDFCSLGVRREP